MKVQHVSGVPGLILRLTLVGMVSATRVSAEPSFQGSENCQKCHEAEYGEWEQTKHFASYREVHKLPKAKEILAAVGGAASMKKHQTCVLCHYTMVQDPADPEVVAQAGPSCESCHGAASDWIAVHNDYGGPDVTRETESAEHKGKRLTSAQAAGMRWPFMKYELASHCMSCHALTHPGLDGAALATMLDAGHPLKPEWEFIQYSQGSVRHRFYPPAMTVNSEMAPDERARNFVIGAAAKLVSAKAALAKSKHPTYQAAQKQRVSDATAILSALKSVPEAAALLAAPTEPNALKLAAAIADKDLSGEVGHLVPDPSTYQ
jgi:hypothetical protein